jgi:putative ABC transport system permease protein
MGGEPVADRGDPEHDRFKAMYDQHYPAVLRYASRRVGAEAARDIAAETFLTAWRRLDRVPPGQPLPWLYATGPVRYRPRAASVRIRESSSSLRPCRLSSLARHLRVDTNGIALTAASPALKATVGATLAHGGFLNAATVRYPAVVLGAEAASLLGIANLAHPAQVWIGGHWFTVVGILNPITQETAMDSMAFIGFPVAEQYFAFDGHPTELYVRSIYTQVNAVADVLAATVNPADPSTVSVTELSGILQAEVVTKGAYNTLFLGLGAVALLVGGVGIANVMVISVLERRSEIGLRRALGATRRHVAEQFLAEAILLSLLGGLAGTFCGVAATAIYARAQHWHVLIPPLALYGGIGAALAIGAMAGLYPSMRAARLSPTEALRTV